jgi:hypothetical protein
MREPSMFEDMLRYPKKRYNNSGTSDDNPVVLPDRVDQFRDLLWALYAPSVYRLLLYGARLLISQLKSK